jgi:benzylsuccinate CoA-transferase BbsF subunit
LAALEYRDRTGEGQNIDLSEYEAICTTMGSALMDEGVNLNEIFPSGNDDPDLPATPYGCYQCVGEDRWCVVAVFTENQWQGLCNVLGNPAWSGSEKFASLANRKKNRDELDRQIGRWMAGQTAESAVEHLQQAGVPAGVVQDAADLAKDGQLLANDFFVSLDHPALGVIKTDSYPFRLKGSRSTSWRASPLLGEK